MYEVGQQVVYCSHGVCRITGLERRRVDRREISYYVLEPKDQPGTQYYVPSENAAALAKMRPLIQREELPALLNETAAEPWIPEDNRRKQRYREIMCCVDVRQVIGMLKALYAFRRDQFAAGRRLHQCDEGFLRDAEKMLCGELATVLDMPEFEIPAYIQNAIGEPEETMKMA